MSRKCVMTMISTTFELLAYFQPTTNAKLLQSKKSHTKFYDIKNIIFLNLNHFTSPMVVKRAKRRGAPLSTYSLYLYMCVLYG